MRLRERKRVNYDFDESDEEESLQYCGHEATKRLDSDSSSGDSSAVDEEADWQSEEDAKDLQGCSSEDAGSASSCGRGMDEGDSSDEPADLHDRPREVLDDRHHRFSHKPRPTRARVNYCEVSISEGSSKDRFDNSVSDVSPPIRKESTGVRGGQAEVWSPFSSSFAVEEEVERGQAITVRKNRRRLVKLADRARIPPQWDDTRHLQTSNESLLENGCSGKGSVNGNVSFHASLKAQGLNGVLKAARIRRQDGGLKAGHITRQESTSSDYVSSSSGETQADAQMICSATDDIKLLPHVYCRRQRSFAHLQNVKAKPAAAIMKSVEETSMQELKVDAFGLYTDLEGSRPIAKRVGLVEKILSVKNRGTDAAIYCVKLNGRSYRNVVYVRESVLSKDYVQLWRHFLRRMDDLKRVNGNVVEKEDSPAFNPSYIQIDRVLALEQRGRKKFFLVKWKELPYSESTWESEDALVGDKVSLKRFFLLSTKGAPGSNTLAFKDGRTLRDYQKKGVAWMDHNYKSQVNCILADEMGLGKTIQAVAMLQTLRVKWKIRGPFLVVAPVSTLGHWQREIEALTDMNCLLYSGNADDRNVMKEYEFYTDDTDLKFNVLLTGFEVLMKDHHFLSKQEWQYIIVDEAHRLKTKQSKTSRTLKEMSVRKGGLLLLTGTPVQNNTKEIFSLLNILDSESFKSEEEFLAKYGDIKDAEQVRDLQENVLKPRLLRRMKEDVEKSIPLKEETIIWVELTKNQRSYYKAIYENRISDLLKGSQNSNMPNLRNVAMELRKLCNHPFLCDGLEEHMTFKSSKDLMLREQRREDSLEALCQSSGKMLLLDKLLPKLKEAGRRVLIFSQFTIMLDLLEEYLDSKGYSYERIDGKIRGTERQAAIDRYSAKGSETLVFLLSTRAGGLGITLTAADTCVIYDSDWNPQNDLQAMARCHRIGQTKDVKVYRLITRNTYEQHLFECSSRKYGLDEAILGNLLESNINIEHTKNIETLLKRGAYDILKEDGEAEAAAFHAQNIDQILEQRTQQRVIGSRGNNTFSVATFISNNDLEVEAVDDGDGCKLESEQFWQDLLPEAYHAAAADAAKPPPVAISAGPRRRARVNYKEQREASDNEEGSSSDEDDKYDGRKQASHKRNKDIIVEDAFKQWSEKELKCLESRLVVLGKGREEQAMMEAKLEHRGLVEIRQVADVLIQIFQFFEERERKALSAKDVEPSSKQDGAPKVESSTNQSQDVKVVTDASFSIYLQDPEWPKIPSFAQRALSSPYCLMRIQKNATRYLQTLHERAVLSRALSDPNFLGIPVSRSKKLPQWWGGTEDLHLMKGALKHGHKEFFKIREDPDFCFLSRLNARKSNEGSICWTEPYQSGETQESLQEDGWPHDSVLAVRLKKLIESLPNGLSDREVKRRAAVAEAARKRWWSAKQQGQESATAPHVDSGNLQRGFIAYIDGIRYEQFQRKEGVSNGSICHPQITGPELTSRQEGAQRILQGSVEALGARHTPDGMSLDPNGHGLEVSGCLKRRVVDSLLSNDEKRQRVEQS